jgi:hypothetical protein
MYIQQGIPWLCREMSIDILAITKLFGLSIAEYPSKLAVLVFFGFVS